ncbi:acyl-CoA thioesterase [Klenkia brasiliensis]|uniref:Acyl-CoA thioester hydrolase n=1 Tax=Klenkia brasiliensis TaxID=333142 RepID=A0A1G7V0Z3_9ACTN|nr:thioesterase family protein [Klenkia brasiliensis]SDG53171.1 acyl-CoA thioester hydrolase [Klenkia brasiliensis]
MRHRHAVQLRWSDPDVYGHVNHARALSLLEDARLAMGAGHEGGVAPPIILARLEVDYRRQLLYRAGESVDVDSWVTRLGGSSVTVRQDLHQDGEVAISVVAVLVHVADDASRPMTAAERAHWTTFSEDAAG